MAFVTGDVVPTPGEETPFKVVFKRGEEIIIEWPVDSKAAGETDIIETLASLADDEEDGDD
ncbi:MAG: hypothetical protein KDJ37_06580 [Hyphomicrobiaceae bacterium]|nr:hypothetical protein [Hyphomicrobiaceae bacterium]